MEHLKHYPISICEIFRARKVVSSYLRPTGLIHYSGLSAAIGAEVFVKHENHHPTGVFKIRGGLTLMHHLAHLKAPGVITSSTGNHGLSIATAARWFGMNATVVVPCNSNPVKIRAIRDAGAELIEAGANIDEASAVVDNICHERGLYFAHPCNEPLLINGVGTGFLEIFEDLPNIDVMIVPLGGGSEAAAAVVTLRALRPEVEIIAVQAEQSPAAYESWKHKRVVPASNKTLAGGLATGTAYEIPFGIYLDELSNFVLLSEDEILDGIGMAMHFTHNLVEAAGAATIMAALKMRDKLKGRKVVLQMSGCNASPTEIRNAVKRKSFASGILA